MACADGARLGLGEIAQQPYPSRVAKRLENDDQGVSLGNRKQLAVRASAADVVVERDSSAVISAHQNRLRPY